MSKENIQELIEGIASKARKASLQMTRLTAVDKNNILSSLIEKIASNREAILEANKIDTGTAKANGLAQAMVDRLTFTEERLDQLIEGIHEVKALKDPVGEEIDGDFRPNGLHIKKIRVAIGVIGIIYESRPNVTIDCAILCLKSGNACILRGGKEAYHTNTILAKLIREAIKTHGQNPDIVQFIPTTDREALTHLLKQHENIHCIIPRGGESLIRFVAENSLIPVIKHYKGVCNLYVDKDADLEIAGDVTINAKCQRPGVCNSIENLIIHKDVAETFLPAIAERLGGHNVKLKVDKIAKGILSSDSTLSLEDATEEDYYTEFLDLTLSIKIVASLDEGIEFINTYGSAHSESIITRNEETADIFFKDIDSSTIYRNASTRFTDGFEFGLGAEIGISTDRLHARGPMGLRELCTYKYIVTGEGQIKA